MAMDTALVIIDVQRGMFSNPDELLYQSQELLERLGTLLSKARAAGVLVLFVRHNDRDERSPLHPSNEGWQIHPAIAPLPEEPIIDKYEPDSFFNTSLQQELDSRGIRRLVIGGMQTDFCVDASCRQAFNLGYELTLVADGHSTWANNHMSAEQVVNHYRKGGRKARAFRPGMNAVLDSQ